MRCLTSGPNDGLALCERDALFRLSTQASTSSKSHTTQRGVRLKRRGNSHYATAIVPARAAHPKDKAIVEGLVKILMRYVRFRAEANDGCASCGCDAEGERAACESSADAILSLQRCLPLREQQAS